MQAGCGKSCSSSGGGGSSIELSLADELSVSNGIIAAD